MACLAKLSEYYQTSPTVFTAGSLMMVNKNVVGGGYVIAVRQDKIAGWSWAGEAMNTMNFFWVAACDSSRLWGDMYYRWLLFYEGGVTSGQNACNANAISQGMAGVAGPEFRGSQAAFEAAWDLGCLQPREPSHYVMAGGLSSIHIAPAVSKGVGSWPALYPSGVSRGEYGEGRVCFDCWMDTSQVPSVSAGPGVGVWNVLWAGPTELRFCCDVESDPGPEDDTNVTFSILRSSCRAALAWGESPGPCLMGGTVQWADGHADEPVANYGYPLQYDHEVWPNFSWIVDVWGWWN
ncbi:hypothetical protein FJY63_10170 [Candidatus Sumerlaeota bacterium]|nr:hypothetical protein [Candidatus Sumerlaeota bacterium]